MSNNYKKMKIEAEYFQHLKKRKYLFSLPSISMMILGFLIYSKQIMSKSPEIVGVALAFGGFMMFCLLFAYPHFKYFYLKKKISEFQGLIDEKKEFRLNMKNKIVQSLEEQCFFIKTQTKEEFEVVFKFEETLLLYRKDNFGIIIGEVGLNNSFNDLTKDLQDEVEEEIDNYFKKQIKDNNDKKRSRTVKELSEVFKDYYQNTRAQVTVKNKEDQSE